MIRKPQESFLRKRWVYKLAELKLDPLKISDDAALKCSDDEAKVGNLVAPNIILSEELVGSGGRRYALFDNYVQVYRLCEHVRSNGDIPHLYEICPYFMKIHFDIDVKRDFFVDTEISENEIDSMFRVSGDDKKYFYILRPFLRSIEAVFERFFPDKFNKETIIKDLLVFEAHRPDKISFHIVLDGFYLSCHDCWFFYRAVVEDMVLGGNVLQSQMADFSVYKKNQSFRLFGSNKSTMSSPREGIKRIYNGPSLDVGGNRTFSKESMISSSFRNEPRDERLVNLRILERSLLSHTMGSTRLSIAQTVAKEMNAKTRTTEKQEENVIMDEGEIAKILNVFFNSAVSKTDSGERSFRFLKYVNRGGLICLNRTKENYCRSCDKRHEAENAFLFCTPTGDVNFVCRRAQESRKGGSCLYIGNILN